MKRITNAFSGVFSGFIILVIGVILLWYNEGNNVKNIKTTNEMDKICIDVNSDSINPENNGKLVSTYGKLENSQELTDGDFNITIKTPVLKRIVEVYQWEQHKSTDDDGDTTYSYTKKWSSELIDSRNFYEPNHVNPVQKIYEDNTSTSTEVKVGSFSLSSNQIDTLSTNGVYTDFNQEHIAAMNLNISGKYVTNSRDLNNPAIGDTRISFVYNNSTDISVLAVQTDNTFTDFVSSAGKRVNRIMDGIHSCKEMVNEIKKENDLLKWGLRLFGFILCCAGFTAILKPVDAATSYVPIIGTITKSAVSMISFLLGLCVSLVVIAIAWFAFRPVLSISLGVVAIIVILIVVSKGKNNNSQ